MQKLNKDLKNDLAKAYGFDDRLKIPKNPISVTGTTSKAAIESLLAALASLKLVKDNTAIV